MRLLLVPIIIAASTATASAQSLTVKPQLNITGPLKIALQSLLDMMWSKFVELIPFIAGAATLSLAVVIAYHAAHKVLFRLVFDIDSNAKGYWYYRGYDDGADARDGGL